MCGQADALRWRAARITLGASGALGPGVPRVVSSPPLRLDAWVPDSAHAGALRRDPAGEYLGVAFLRDGSLGVATPIQHPARYGFTWWRMR